jgi:hypothetical protein
MSALSALVPALSAGFQQNMQSKGGLDSLVSALAGGQHSRYLDDPSSLTGAVDDGNGILGHVFGSKDVSRQVAARAAAQTGLDVGILKQMLPLVATMMMGAMARHGGVSASAGGMGASTGGLGGVLGSALGGSGASAGGGLISMLTPMLDSNKDGSIVDDVIGMLGKLGR